MFMSIKFGEKKKQIGCFCFFLFDGYYFVVSLDVYSTYLYFMFKFLIILLSTLSNLAECARVGTILTTIVTKLDVMTF